MKFTITLGFFHIIGTAICIVQSANHAGAEQAMSEPHVLVLQISKAHSIDKDKIIKEVGKDYVLGGVSRKKPLIAIKEIVNKVFEADACQECYICDIGNQMFKHRQHPNLSELQKLRKDDKLIDALLHGIEVGSCDAKCKDKCQPTLREPFKSWSLQSDDDESENDVGNERPNADDDDSKPHAVVLEISDTYGIDREKIIKVVDYDYVLGAAADEEPLICIRRIFDRVFEDTDCRTRYICDIGRMMKSYRRQFHLARHKRANPTDKLIRALMHGLDGGNCNEINNVQPCDPILKEPLKSLSTRSGSRRNRRANRPESKPMAVIKEIGAEYGIEHSSLIIQIDPGFLIGQLSAYKPLEGIVKIIDRVFEEDECRECYICRIGTTVTHYRDQPDLVGLKAMKEGKLAKEFARGIEDGKCGDRCAPSKCKPKLKPKVRPLSSHSHR